MCCGVGECIIKYTLITVNVVFSLLGLAILALGVVAHIQLKELRDLIPVNLNALSVGIIVLGCIVFFIAFLACCGAIIRSMCMLIFYAIAMAIMAAVKIYIVVVIFRFVNHAQTTVTDWLFEAFENENVRPAFIAMETLFLCCGTTGAGAYGDGIIPPSCCANPLNNQCNAADSYGGCNDIVSSWFDSFGAVVGGVIIGVIVFEVLCMIFSLHVCNVIRRDRKGETV